MSAETIDVRSTPRAASDADFGSERLPELLDRRWRQSVYDVTELTVRLHDLHAEIGQARGDKARLSAELADTEMRLAHRRRSLADNDAAIQRLAKGTYGFCGHCGSTIPEEHLAAAPSVRLCASCQFWSCQTQSPIGNAG